MTDWREHLTPDEAARLRELDEQAKAASIERRKIFDRSRKRANRSEQNAKTQTPRKAAPKTAGNRALDKRAD
jgi:hypothetical protein